MEETTNAYPFNYYIWIYTTKSGEVISSTFSSYIYSLVKYTIKLVSSNNIYIFHSKAIREIGKSKTSNDVRLSYSAFVWYYEYIFK